MADEACRTPSHPPTSTGVGRGRSASSTRDTQLQALLDRQDALQAHLERLQLTPQQSPLPALDATAGLAEAELAPVGLSVKLPPYWAADPLAWFAQVDAVFATRRVANQKVKFQHIVASLAPEFISEIRDIIVSPPTEAPYEALKALLITRTQSSEQRRLHQLLTTEELGDRQPTQLLRKMQQLLGTNSMDESLFRQLFEQRLPNNVRMVLASSSASLTLEEVACMADRIMEVAADPGHIHAVAREPQPDRLAKLEAQVQELTTAVKNLTKHRRSGGDRGRSQSRDRRPPQSTPKTNGEASTGTAGYCYYHDRFGANAHSCRPPCSYQSEN